MVADSLFIQSSVRIGSSDVIPHYPVFTNQTPFPTLHSGKSVDIQLHEFVMKNLFPMREQIQRLFIPLSLSADYSNFLGIQLGMHIRLSPLLGRLREVPIVFLGYESREEVCAYNPIGFFLFSKGVYLVRETQEEMEAAIAAQLEGCSNAALLDELELKYAIPVPDMYDSRHAIVNEWGLLFLDKICNYHLLAHEPLLEQIQSNLYVKKALLQSGFEESDWQVASNSTPFLLDGVQHKKILLVDDDHHKGWTQILQRMLRHGEPDGNKVDFVPLEKGDSRREAIHKFESKMASEDWDIVVMDIRLVDEDKSDSEEYWDFTGFELLSRIKDASLYNPGTQVILMSASNKEWIYDYGRDIGADEVIVKPNLSMTKSNYNLDEFFRESFSRCSQRLFLKEIFQLKENILDEFSMLPEGDNEFKEFKSEIKATLEVGFSVFSRIASTSQMDKVTIFLSYYRILDVIAAKWCFWDRGSSKYIIRWLDRYVEEYSVNNGRVVRGVGNSGIQTAHKVLAIMKQVLDYPDDRLLAFDVFRKKRNTWIHEDAEITFSAEECEQIVLLTNKMILDLQRAFGDLM